MASDTPGAPVAVIRSWDEDPRRSVLATASSDSNPTSRSTSMSLGLPDGSDPRGRGRGVNDSSGTTSQALDVGNEIQEFILNGKKQPPEVQVWRRTK